MLNDGMNVPCRKFFQTRCQSTDFKSSDYICEDLGDFLPERFVLFHILVEESVQRVDSVNRALSGFWT